VEIKNTALFFVGVILLVAGSLVVLFDYLQIQFYERLGKESYPLPDIKDQAVYQRLIIEFSIGTTVLSGGIGMIGMSFLGRFQNGIR